MDQRLLRTVRHRGERPHVLPEIVRVWIDRHQFYIDRQRELIGQQEIFLPGGMSSLRVVFQLQQHRQFRRSLRREIKSDAWLDHLRLARWLQVRIQNEVGAFVEAQRHAFGLNVWNGARLPEEQMAVGIKHLRLDANLHTAETCARLGFAFARRARAIHENVRMMHVALVARTNLDRLHPARFLNRHRENEIPIGVDALRRQTQRLRRRQDQVGLSQSPALDELRLRRQIFRIALDLLPAEPIVRSNRSR